MGSDQREVGSQEYCFGPVESDVCQIRSHTELSGESGVLDRGRGWRFRAGSPQCKENLSIHLDRKR